MLLVAAAAGLWGAARLPWVIIGAFDGLGQPRQVIVTGGAWSTALLPLALFCLAACVAALTLRGWPLRVLAVLVAAASLAVGYLAISMWVVRDIAMRALDIADVPLTSLVSVDRRLTGAVVGVVAALGVLAAAALLMRTATHDTSSDTKYVAPAARRGALEDRFRPDGPQMSERMMWDALDMGRDPTEDEGGPGVRT